MEIRSYDGSAETLRDFVVGVWRDTYGGRMAFPLWTPDYFRWQLGVESPAQATSPHLIAAYDGGRLVGTILGYPARFRTPLGERAGSQGSWLSVAREYRRQGVATQLRQELRRRHVEHGLGFQIGYGYFGSPHSLGPSFWQSQRELGTTFFNRVGFWARVLNATRAARFNLSRWEALLTNTLSRLVLPPLERPGHLVLRDYRSSDLADCERVVAAATGDCQLSLIWDATALDRQLSGGGVGQTLAAERDGRVAGLVNWHCLPFLGRTEDVVAVVDVLAMSELTLVEQHRLLWAALSRMQQAGAVLALKLRIGDYERTPLLTTGWVPRWPDSYVLATWGAEPEPFPELTRMHLLWR